MSGLVSQYYRPFDGTLFLARLSIGATDGICRLFGNTNCPALASMSPRSPGKPGGVALPRRETTKVDIVAQSSGARSLRAHRHHQLPAALSPGVASLRRSIRVISHTVESVVMASNPAQMVLLDMVTPTLRA